MARLMGSATRSIAEPSHVKLLSKKCSSILPSQQDRRWQKAHWRADARRQAGQSTKDSYGEDLDGRCFALGIDRSSNHACVWRSRPSLRRTVGVRHCLGIEARPGRAQGRTDLVLHHNTTGVCRRRFSFGGTHAVRSALVKTTRCCDILARRVLLPRNDCMELFRSPTVQLTDVRSRISGRSAAVQG